MTELGPTYVPTDLALETIGRLQRAAALRSKAAFVLAIPTAFVVLLSFCAVITGFAGAVAAGWFFGGAAVAIGVGIGEARRNKLRRNLALASEALVQASAAATLDGDVLEIRAADRWTFSLSRRDVRTLGALPEARLLLRD